MRTRRALGVRGLGVARVGAAGDHPDRGQEPRQGPYRRRFRRPLLPAHQHAPDLGRDGVQEQGQLQVLLPDDGGERVRRGQDPNLARRKARANSSVATSRTGSNRNRMLNFRTAGKRKREMKKRETKNPKAPQTTANPTNFIARYTREGPSLTPPPFL